MIRMFYYHYVNLDILQNGETKVTEMFPHLHSSTTTESAFAGMNPKRKTLRQPQL